jgi:tagatose 6-phosphate kinase
MIFDRLTLDDVNRAKSVVQATAGKNNNAARVLTTLGEQAIATGFLGGETGTAIRRDLDNAGVKHDYVEVASPTRLCVTVIDRSTNAATELIEEAGPATASEVEQLLSKLQSLIRRAPGAGAPSVLLLMGSLAPGVPADFYRRCVEMANAAGWLSVVDASGEPLTRSLAAKPFLVKPNKAELSRTVGRPIDTNEEMRAAVRELISQGPQWVVVTMGKDGAVVSDGRSFTTLRSPKITPVSAIGSGDSFAAGLAAGIVRGKSVPDAVKLAIACGAANALTEMAGHLSLADVERLQQQVTIAE